MTKHRPPTRHVRATFLVALRFAIFFAGLAAAIACVHDCHW